MPSKVSSSATLPNFNLLRSMVVRPCTNKTVKILIAFDINNILQSPCCWPRGRFLRAKPNGKKYKLLRSGWPAAAPLCPAWKTLLFACDLAISIALSSVNLAPFEINFSLTLSEFHSEDYFSFGSLKSQSWARIRNAVMNFSAVSDESWTRLWNLNLAKTGFALGLTWLSKRS